MPPAPSPPVRPVTAPGVRPMVPGDVVATQQIERAAGAAFLDVGLPEIAADEPFSAEELAPYIAQGRAWVIAPDDDRILGYVLTDVVDAQVHIEQVSVHPDGAHRGLGRRLIDHVAALAIADGIGAVTLTTFRDVPWNAPYYERCGFRVIPDAQLGPELRAVRDHEATLGLDPAQRVCMRRDLARS